MQVSEGEKSYSLAKSYEEQIEDVINGVHNPRMDVYVSDTPSALVSLNFSQEPILMRNSKVMEIIKNIPKCRKSC